MEVYVIRHGEAEPSGAGGDAARRLTPAGRAAVAAAARGLAALGVKLDRLFTSPLVRARETAREITAALGGGDPEVLPLLAPGGGTPEEILRALDGAGERVAVVGHQPTLGELVAVAISGAGSGGVALRPGAAARLEFEGSPRPGAGRLRWLVTAEQLARVAAGDARAPHV